MNTFRGLPKIEPDVAALYTALAGRQWHFESQFLVFGSEADVVPCPVAVEFHPLDPLPERFMGLSAESGFGSFDIFIEPELVYQISDICLPGWNQEPPAAVRSDWLALFALSQVTESIGLNLDVEAAWAERGFIRLKHSDLTGAISGTMHMNGGAYAFVVRTWVVQADTVAALIGHTANWGTGLTDPGFKLEVQPAPLPVSLNDFRQLSEGDILLIRSGAAGIPVQAWLGRTMYWDGTLKFDGTATLQGKGKRIKGMQDQDYLPSEESEFEANSEAFFQDDEDIRLDTPKDPQRAAVEEMQAAISGFPLAELPVRLDFKLDSKTLTLDAFSRLGSGSVLDLDFDLDSALTIEANGTPVGTGQLVQIGDSIGLQVLKWHPRRAASDE